MKTFDLDKFIREQQKQEEERQKMIAEQIRKGCDKCSQWDSYWGCDKCERI